MKNNKPPAEDAAEGNKVGYGKPPKNSRFSPGSSGNPKGRPKGTKNLKTDLIEELSERIVVREGDRSRRVSKQRALVKQLMAKTLRGDNRAASLLLSAIMRLLDTGEGLHPIDEPLRDDEREILAAFEARQSREAECDEISREDRDGDAGDPQ